MKVGAYVRMHPTYAAYCYRRRTFRGLCLCVFWTHQDTRQKPLNRSRSMLLGADLCEAKEPCISDGGAHWRHLTNTTERSVRDGDAAFAYCTVLSKKLKRLYILSRIILI